MRELAVGVAVFAVLTSSACAVVEGERSLASTEPGPRACGAPVVLGRLEPSSHPDRVRVTLEAEDTCTASRLLRFKRERALAFDTQGKTLVTAGAGIAGAFAAIGLYAAASGGQVEGSFTTSNAIGYVLVMVGFGVGSAIGLFPAFMLQRPLPGSVEVVDRAEAGARRTLPIDGALVSSDGARQWALAHGGVELELASFEPADLERATVNGVQVTWGPEARERLAALLSCRRAARAVEACEAKLEALQCAEGGWTLADPVLRASGTCIVTGVPDAGRSFSLVPSSLPDAGTIEAPLRAAP